MSQLGQTVRIPELDQLNAVDWNDVLAIVDTSDLSGSVDGTDKYIRIRELFESAPIRPSDDQAVSNSLATWVSSFRNSITTLTNKTKDATTEIKGISEHATDDEAKAKTGEKVITSSNLAALGATEALAGLMALASATEVREGTVNNKAITPKTLFDEILGDAVINANSSVFKFPVKNVVGDVKMEFVLQIGEKDFSTMATEMDAVSNFNHIHQSVSFEITYPQQFDNRALLVIPYGIEIDPNTYTESTDFWIRPYEIRINGATLKASRLGGTNAGAETARVRYIVIGY